MSALRQSLSLVRAATFLALIVACHDVSDPVVPSESLNAASKRKPQPPADTQAPTIPVFSLVDVGPTHISLRWSSTDASLPILYSVARVGDVSRWMFDTSGTFKALQPVTTYSFVAKARDNTGNWSELSAPFSVTTPAPDPNDVTPPTAPTNVWAEVYDGATEIQVFWTPSTDNVTPQSVIIYHMFVNGARENSSAGVAQTTGYGVRGENTITVIAVDGAGNRSAAGSFRLFIPF